MNDLPTLHSKASELLVWNLSNRVRDMRCSAGEVSQAVEATTGDTPLPTDPAKEVDAGSDIGGSEGGGVKL